MFWKHLILRESRKTSIGRGTSAGCYFNIVSYEHMITMQTHRELIDENGCSPATELYAGKLGVTPISNPAALSGRRLMNAGSTWIGLKCEHPSFGNHRLNCSIFLIFNKSIFHHGRSQPQSLRTKIHQFPLSASRSQTPGRLPRTQQMVLYDHKRP